MFLTSENIFIFSTNLNILWNIHNDFGKAILIEANNNLK